MLDDGAGPECLTVDRGALLDDGGVGDGGDDARPLMVGGVVEGEHHGGECLAAAGGDGEAEEAGGLLGGGAAGGEHLGADAVDLGGGGLALEVIEVGGEAGAQGGQRGVVAGADGGLLGLVEALGVEKVRVAERGEEQPRPHLEAMARGVPGRSSAQEGRQLRERLVQQRGGRSVPAGDLEEAGLLLEAFLQLREVGEAPAVVSCDGEGDGDADLAREPRSTDGARARMVPLTGRSAFKVRLEAVLLANAALEVAGVLAEVMPEPGEAGEGFSCER